MIGFSPRIQEANRHSRKKEKVLEAGRFHFKFLTEPELNVARKLFGEMDQDGDCRVHSNEVIDFLISKGMPSTEAQKIFDNMALMQNSYLTFEDLVAFWYVLVNRPVCDGCSDIIMGSYYTCDACFYAYNDGGDTNTYDLCHGCYSKNGKYDAHREHGIFVDNTALLLHLKDQKVSIHFKQYLFFLYVCVSVCYWSRVQLWPGKVSTFITLTA